MDKLSGGEIIKLLDNLIGPTEAVGETNADNKIKKNVDTLIDITYWCLDKLIDSSKTADRPEASMKEIGELAQKALDEYKEYCCSSGWTSVKDHNPEIDMSYPHSDTYWVKYKDGGYDVARFCNYNRFWVHQVLEPPWWNCAQYCEVEAWRRIDLYNGEKPE